MPRGNLRERYVQTVAVDWLAARLRANQSVQAVVAETETRVRAEMGMGFGRADGLVAALHSDGSIHVASLEAKSTRTFANIHFYYHDRLWLSHMLAVGALGLLPALTAGWYMNHWFIVWVLPAISFFVSAFLFASFTYDHPRYHAADVIKQVRRYPANEQWIALSTDAYNQLTQEGQSRLRTRCRHEGIGLLRVSAGARVTVLETATAKPTPVGLVDYLACYARGDAMRQQLHGPTVIALESEALA